MSLTREQFIKEIEEETKRHCVDIFKERAQEIWGLRRIAVEDICAAIYSSRPHHQPEILDAEITSK